METSLYLLLHLKIYHHDHLHMCILPALFLGINICIFEVRRIWEPMQGKKHNPT